MSWGMILNLILAITKRGNLKKILFFIYRYWISVG